MSSSKVIVITGVTHGIGLTLSKCFARNGHKVIGCGRSHDKIESLNKSFESTGSLFSVVDVSVSDSVLSWSKQTIQKYGAPDLIVNNAAITNTLNNLWEVPLVEFDKVMDINLKGVNYVIHFYLPEMIKAKRGVVINLSSGWGRSTSAQVAPYCCTKWGIEGLSLALAQELPKPLACAPLNPGTINTDMLEKVFGDDAKNYRTPEQWAETAGPFLLSLDRSCNGKQLRAP